MRIGVWVVVVVALVSLRAAAAEEPAKAGPVVLSDGTTVELSPPVLVARSSGYLWFPTLAKAANGDLLAMMNNYADTHTADSTALTAWSRDGGRTWGEARPAKFGDVPLTLPSSDLLLLPYYLRPAPGGAITAPYQLVKKDSRELQLVDPGVSVAGWPRPQGSFDAKLGLAGFIFSGSTVRSKDGRYLATLYGLFEKDRFFSLVLAESADGVKWTIRSLIADVTCGFKGSGPDEAAICRLADGRLMCVFRNDGKLPYGQTFSADDGRTWDKPVQMKDVFSVQPSLLVTAGGPILLSGGRPGLFVWANLDGTGKQWERIDIAAHHNAAQPQEPIDRPDHTSSCTELVALDDNTALLIYDRIPHGWKAIPKDSKDTNSVWVVRVTLRGKR